MKKLNLLLAAVLMLGLAACDSQREKQAALSDTFTSEDSLQQIITQKENELNDIIGTLNEIQTGFRQINEAEGRVNVERAEGSAANRQEIIENMEFIQKTMAFNRDLIANLRQQLKSASTTNSRLKKTLEETVNSLTAELEKKTAELNTLREELAQKDIRIAQQQEEISTLHENVNTLTADNAGKTRTLAAQEEQLNTAYYVFGTKKELREQNILKRGDVLRSGDFNTDYFTRIDVRVTKTIKLYSKSAKLLTSHPEGSYSLDKDAQGQYTLRITDVQKFWSVSKYLVITVK